MPPKAEGARKDAVGVSNSVAEGMREGNRAARVIMGREQGDGLGLGVSVEHLQGLVHMEMCSEREMHTRF